VFHRELPLDYIKPAITYSQGAEPFCRSCHLSFGEQLECLCHSFFLLFTLLTQRCGPRVPWGCRSCTLFGSCPVL
jgi:hypothetical protein